MAKSQDCLVHWTDKEGFDGIVRGGRIVGLTEGRVYLHKGKSAPCSIVGKNYKIVLKGFNGAERHPVSSPLSWWSLFKIFQWVSPSSTNIVWDTNRTPDPNGRTLVVCGAKVESQEGFAKYSGITRLWLRWFAIDWLPIWAIMFIRSIDLDWILDNLECHLLYLICTAVFITIALLVVAWFYLQKKVNNCAIMQYRNRKIRPTTG